MSEAAPAWGMGAGGPWPIRWRRLHALAVRNIFSSVMLMGA